MAQLVSEVSEEGQDLMEMLVAWEMIGADSLDPHAILREAFEEDLDIVRENIALVPGSREFLSIQMIELELLYRRGMLATDWSCLMKDNKVTLCFELIHHTYWDAQRERVTA